MERTRVRIDSGTFRGEGVTGEDGTVPVFGLSGLRVQPDARVSVGWGLPAKMFHCQPGQTHSFEIPRGRSIRDRITPPVGSQEEGRENTLPYCLEPVGDHFGFRDSRRELNFGRVPVRPTTGWFRIDNLAHDQLFWIRPPDAVSPWDAVRWTAVGDAATRTVEFEAPPGVLIRGQVIQSDTRMRESCNICLWPAGEVPDRLGSPPPLHWERSSDDGTFSFALPKIPLGTYWLQAICHDAPPSRIHELTVTEDATVLECNLHLGTGRVVGRIDTASFPDRRVQEMHRERSLTVHLVDPHLEPLDLFVFLPPQITHDVRSAAIWDQFGAAVDPRGHFAIDGIPPGEWLLMLCAGGSHLETKRITVRAEAKGPGSPTVVQVPWVYDAR